MIHHPPIRGATSMHKRMIGIRRFAATISAGGAELVLHGHTHLNTLHWLKGHTGPVPVVGIASASQGPGGSKPVAAYNLFSVDGEPGDWRLTRALRDQPGRDRRGARRNDVFLKRRKPFDPGRFKDARRRGENRCRGAKTSFRSGSSLADLGPNVPYH